MKTIVQSPKTLLMLLCVALVSPLLVWLRFNPVFRFDLFDRRILNYYTSYQFIALIITVLFIIIIYVLADRVHLRYLNLSHRDGAIVPEPFIGIKPARGETWRSLGLNFLVIISVVTMIVIFLQNIYGRTISIVAFPDLALVVVLAVSNSFSEEVIYRLSFVSIVDNEKLPPRLSQALSAVTFGAIHYFGNPAGIPGILMAAFIGWFLAKSMNETRGFFWAWLIHFVQDIIILFAIFAV